MMQKIIRGLLGMGPLIVLVFVIWAMSHKPEQVEEDSKHWTEVSNLLHEAGTHTLDDVQKIMARAPDNCEPSANVRWTGTSCGSDYPNSRVCWWGTDSASGVLLDAGNVARGTTYKYKERTR